MLLFFLSDKKSRKFNLKAKVVDQTECRMLFEKLLHFNKKLTIFLLKFHRFLNERLLEDNLTLTEK